MIQRLVDSLDQLASDPAHRLLIIEGQGEHFCAGRDVAQLDAPDRSAVPDKAQFEILVELLYKLHAHPRPVIAVVRGYCLGLGAALVCMADIAYTVEGARFGFPEVKIGVSPSFTAVALSLRVASKHSTELLFSGRQIDAVEAASIGLVSECFQGERAEALMAERIEALRSVSNDAQSLCKTLIRTRPEQLAALRAELDSALEVTVQSASSSDAREGRRAFLEKRAPQWR